MFKRKMGFALVALMLTIALALSGCTTKDKSPKDALQSSMSKSADIKSYNFTGSMVFEDFNFPAEGDGAAEAAAALNLMKSAELSWTGAYRADPMLMELNLKLALQGDLAITFNIPVVMTQKKVWIKVPNIPMLPIPETVVDKFIELDLEQLAEEAGQPLPNVDVAKSQKFANDLMEIVFKHVDADTHLKTVKAKDVGLPSDVNASQVVQFHLDQSQLETFVNTVIEKIAPEVIELLSTNAEYRDMLQLKQEDLDQAKAELENAKSGDASEAIAEMKQELKKLDVTVNYAIDKKDYPIYTDAKISAAIESEELTGSVGIKVVSHMTGINEAPKFEIGEPKAEEVMTLEEVEAEMGGLLGGFGGEF
ncbi:hypothetical protein [Cohnella cellulosilytica]|uniref:Lipoprotein n=1 Tax=Cohnella cellulosilytica TaxID=986710 RepID=A0ABW2FKP9_9BACL